MAFRNICSLTFRKTITLEVVDHSYFVLIVSGIVVFNRKSNVDVLMEFDLLS